MQVVATTPTLLGEKVDKTVKVGEERFGPNLGISRRLESKICSHMKNIDVMIQVVILEGGRCWASESLSFLKSSFGYFSLEFFNTVPIGYGDLGYSDRAAYSDLIPNGTRSSGIT